ncbi:ABC transporter permease [Alicyclobacillus macrosporangiidus]|uniref:ABC transporter permease n=1 Tax=Alicyclobacillus macrosporangiidus TaxID=392015 RepID=UPI0004975D09|nr:ABC transporter permease [Alicyclobacillus macrosporangiidus]
MLAYIGRRLLLSVVVMFGLSVITFFIARVVPADPAARFAGPRATPQEIAQARIELGLDKPLWVQYAKYMAGLVHGDLGVSIDTHHAVSQDVLNALPASLELMVCSLVIALALGIPIGVWGAMRPGGLADGLGRLFAVAGVSFPSFWLGFLLQLLFVGVLHLLPVAGRVSDLTQALNPIQSITGFYLVDSALQGNWSAFSDAAAHLILPALTLAAYPFGLVVRMVRAVMLDVLSQDHVRVLRSLGMPSRTIAFRYALINAMPATLTVIALSMAYALTGTFLIESVFSWPGLGNYTANALVTNDYPAIMGITLLTGMAYVFLNLVVDVCISLLDPRVRWTG